MGTHRLTALLLTGLGLSLGCGTGSTGASGPQSIQPQPIPEDGFTGSFDTSAFQLQTVGTMLTLSGRALTMGPSGIGPAGGASVSAFDATTAGGVARAVAAVDGAFTLALGAGAATDQVFVFFDADVAGPSASLLARGGPGAAATVVAPCLLSDLATGLEVGALPAGAVRSLPLSITSTCGTNLTIDSVRVTGESLVTGLPAPFAVKPGSATGITLQLTGPNVPSFVSFVVFGEGARRHVIALHGTRL
jgi:hypothetical protein